MADPENLDHVQVTVQEDVIPNRKEKCMNCCKKFIAFLFSTIGLSCLLVGYAIAGGFIFKNLEAPNEVQLKSNVQQTRRWHVEKLWNLTEDLNVLYRNNWTEIADSILENYTRQVYIATKKKGWDGKDGAAEIQWTFAGSMLYSITVITTIGYGHISPKTPWGRVVTIFYAVVGIPLNFITMANLGGFMATAFRFMYRNICCGLFCLCCQKSGQIKSSAVKNAKYKEAENGDPGASKALAGETGRSSKENSPTKYPVRVYWRHGLQRILKTEDMKTVTVPLYISFFLIASYILAGAVLFTVWEEEWDYLIGSYFCFVTLTTIGFGDFVPGTSVDSWAAQEKLIFCAFYLIFGLALIAMCFDLMQQELREKCRYIGYKLGLLDKNKK